MDHPAMVHQPRDTVPMSTELTVRRVHVELDTPLPPDQPVRLAPEVRGFVGNWARHRLLHAPCNAHLAAQGLRKALKQRIPSRRAQLLQRWIWRSSGEIEPGITACDLYPALRGAAPWGTGSVRHEVQPAQAEGARAQRWLAGHALRAAPVGTA
jgi:hypothetical protein